MEDWLKISSSRHMLGLLLSFVISSIATAPFTFGFVWLRKMQALSEELLLCIVSRVTTSRELKRLRLVSKRFALIAAEQLFQTVIGRVQQSSLQKLTAISKHPVLSTKVKTLIYEADGHLQDYWNLDARQIQYNKLIGLLRHETRDAWLFGFALDEASHLAYIMANLPNLVHVRFETSSDLRAGLAEQPAPSLPEHLRGCGVRSLVAITRAASTTTANSIKHLETSNDALGLHYSFLSLEGLDMYHIVRVFANLTRIAFYLNTNEGEHGSNDVLQTGNLSLLLTAARNLQHLSIGFDQRPHARVHLAHLLGSGTWTRLTTLDISAIDFHVWELRAFLQRHPTLTRIGLANSRLHSGTLRQLLDLLRDTAGLECVALDGALGDGSGEFDFLECSANRSAAVAYVFGLGEYPNFEVTVTGTG